MEEIESEGVGSKPAFKGNAPLEGTPSYLSAAEALERLGIEGEDRLEVEDAIGALGCIDPSLGERVFYDRVALDDAADAPLRRTPVEQWPAHGEAPAFFTQTLFLPSGRILQIQRRFPDADEIDAALRAGSCLKEAALWLREIVLHPDERAALHRGDIDIPWIDAATVIAPNGP